MNWGDIMIMIGIVGVVLLMSIVGLMDDSNAVDLTHAEYEYTVKIFSYIGPSRALRPLEREMALWINEQAQQGYSVQSTTQTDNYSLTIIMQRPGG